mmetsp:Transcript_37602/g.77249  ORF Transcript_37602/g.77249 Transcript_37602/m.77249 type:complete len:83 (-) Transcript_37602:688-936(-)
MPEQDIREGWMQIMSRALWYSSGPLPAASDAHQVSMSMDERRSAGSSRVLGQARDAFVLTAVAFVMEDEPLVVRVECWLLSP